MAYDATPSASGINAVVGLSNGAQTAYTGFAAITRFNPSGNIDARSGGAYSFGCSGCYKNQETSRISRGLQAHPRQNSAKAIGRFDILFFS